MSPRKESRPVEKDKADQSKQPIITLILRFAPSQNTRRWSHESPERPAARAFPSPRCASSLCINRRAATKRVKPRRRPAQRKGLRQAHFHTALSNAWPAILTQRFAIRGVADATRDRRHARKNPSSTQRRDKVETCDWHHSTAVVPRMNVRQRRPHGRLRVAPCRDSATASSSRLHKRRSAGRRTRSLAGQRAITSVTSFAGDHSRCSWSKVHCAGFLSGRQRSSRAA